jgi:hypothetical protein
MYRDKARVYVAPRAYVDSILPLSIRPAPTKLASVFVGRMELKTSPDLPAQLDQDSRGPYNINSQ